MLEQQMHEMRGLPERVTKLELQILQFRAEVRDEFSATRTELRAEIAAAFAPLRDAIVETNTSIRQTDTSLRQAIAETNTSLRQAIADVNTSLGQAIADRMHRFARRSPRRTRRCAYCTRRHSLGLPPSVKGAGPDEGDDSGGADK